MAPAPPPKFVLPPPKNKKQAQGQAAYRNYINKHPALKPYAEGIYRAAAKYGVDPVHYAALVYFESGGKPNAQSDADAWGLAQIHIPTWKGKPDPRDGHIITEAEIKNPGWNLMFGAYLLGTAVKAEGGDYNAAYNKHYNPPRKGQQPIAGPHRGPFADIPGSYVPTTASQSPQDKAATSVETSIATAKTKQKLTDPYVTVNSKGKLIKTQNAAHAIKVWGQPITYSQYKQLAGGINDTYLAYTGRPASNKQIASVIKQGMSQYQLTSQLTKGPHFTDSPVWKQNAPTYKATWEGIYGPGSKPDQKEIAYAIANNLTGEAFAYRLRQRKDYETSNEFKTNEASLSGVYSKIYSVPDAAGNQVIKQAARQGQTPDMFASYLRAQPEYQQSAEFKSRALGLASALGMITGNIPTSSGATGGIVGQTPNPNPQANPAGVLGGR